MTWYAETPSLRRRQIVVDAVVALWTLLWLRTPAERSPRWSSSDWGLRVR